jgi:hypothetical protein
MLVYNVYGSEFQTLQFVEERFARNLFHYVIAHFIDLCSPVTRGKRSIFDRNC